MDGRSRELRVSLWYPAAKTKGTAAPYVTPQESALILKGFPQLKDLPPDTLTKTKTKTYARADAPALPNKGGWPLVVMSPGMTMPRATLTSLAEEFASRGYVVAGIEHTYESVATTFPDGRTVTFEAGAGGQTPTTPAKPITKPFMMIGNPRQQPVTSGAPRSWDLFWPHVTGRLETLAHRHRCRARELRRLRRARSAARHAGVPDQR
ncbi:hypothetical protein [Microbispora sp. H13382]|uniref:alpha/beta hydrolase n=1 Tax=Microbispora sp. H13382 TaxID=2729112 RepID=UPI001C728F74|nr:hypothetical protein [Microbispora sp. H13382]